MRIITLRTLHNILHLLRLPVHRVFLYRFFINLFILDVLHELLVGQLVRSDPVGCV